MARFDHTAYAMADEDALWFGGVAAREGRRNNIYGTAGEDVLEGTARGDNFRVDQGGNDTLRGGAGSDRFFFGQAWTDKDSVHGGSGIDRVIATATSDSDIVLGPNNFDGLEVVKLTGSGDFSFRLRDGIGDLRIQKTQIDGTLNVDGSGLVSSNLRVVSGYADDIIIGGAGDDRISGGVGGDFLTGGLGRDMFRYYEALDSNVNPNLGQPDVITDFSVEDRIRLPEISAGFKYHVGRTTDHTGDVVAHYSAGQNITSLSIFLDSDDRVDMLIYLTGEHEDIEIVHDRNIVLV